jgi:hypothetical protein
MKKCFGGFQSPKVQKIVKWQELYIWFFMVAKNVGRLKDLYFISGS